MTERRARRLTCRRVGNNRVRPPVREIDRYTYMYIAGLAPRARPSVSVRKTTSESARERGRGARALHGVPLPRATAARFKSVAPGPSSRRDFARYSRLSLSRIVLVIRAIVVLGLIVAARWTPIGDTRRESLSVPYNPCSGFFVFFFFSFIGSVPRYAITRVPRRRRWRASPGIISSVDAVCTSSRRSCREISRLKDRPVSARAHAQHMYMYTRTCTHGRDERPARSSECHSRCRAGETQNSQVRNGANAASFSNCSHDMVTWSYDRGSPLWNTRLAIARDFVFFLFLSFF